MSGYCKDCGNQYCLCDDIKSHPLIRKHKEMIREGFIVNPEDLEWKEVNDITPEEFTGEKYLTYPYYKILEYMYQGFYSNEGKEYVTHWMHLPKPPKGVE